jgi:signal transduction histidine kinase
MRIRTRLLLLTLAVLVPAIAAAALGIAFVFAEERDVNQHNLQETSRAMALVVDRELATREILLQALATSPALARGDLVAFHEHARVIADERQSSIILTEADGRALLNTRLPPGSPLKPLLPAAAEERRLAGPDGTIVSNLYQLPGRLEVPPSFAIQVPVPHVSGPRLYLAMTSPASQLQSLFVQQGLPREWHASIVDRDGVVVARNVDAGKFVGTRVRAELRARLAEGEGRHSGTSLGGMDGTAYFSRVPRSGWMFVVSVPDAQMQRTGLRASALLGTMTLLLLGLAVAAAFFVGRRTARPMEALRQAAEQLGRGEPVRPQASGLVEVDAVHGALATAGDRLREANAELEQRVAAAVASYERSQQALAQAQKLEALGRLTGGIAHDFNNVLQTLTTGLHAARLGSGEKVRTLLATCERAVGRGSELARQLMVFGRVQEVRVETFDLARRLREAHSLLCGALPTDITFSMDLAPGLGAVTVDPLQLELALLNLVMNARDAMPGGGTLRLHARDAENPSPAEGVEPGEYVAISLQDSGEGMSDEVLARAVDPFFTTKAVGRGSGMGLAQAYGFARQSGGMLVLRSRVGEGTTATLVLPRAQSQPQAQGVAAPAAGLHGVGRVLLVEDDPLVRDTVCTGLEVSGFEVRTATNADEALRIIDDDQTLDVVLTDVVMPGSMNGIDLARLISERYPRLRVVISTGYSDRSVDVPGVRALAKPYALEQAVAALNEAMAR